MLSIEPFLDADQIALSSLQPEGWQPILTPFSFYLQSSNCFPIKVIANGRMAGVGAAILHEDIAWLAHIIVHPDFRKQGIGLKITNALLDICRKKQIDSVRLIATDLGAPVYEKAGFRTETEYLFYKDLKGNLQLTEPSESVVPTRTSLKTSC